jgi:hypothetical protein
VAFEEYRARKPTTAAAALEIGTGVWLGSFMVVSLLLLDR